MNVNLYFRVIHQIITTGHWITDQVSQVLKDDGISEPQYNVMRTLAEAKGQPVSVQHIRNCMVQRSSNVTRIIDKLLSKEFVERRECPANRRKMDITLTDSGRTFLKKLDKKVHRFHQPMFAHLNESELEVLFQSLKKLKSQNHE